MKSVLIAIILFSVATSAATAAASTSRDGGSKSAELDKAQSLAFRAPVQLIRDAATDFLDSLDPVLRKQATFSMTDDERRSWSNLPSTMFKRQGVSFKEMSSVQKVRAHKLLQSTLSSQGYLKSTGIMSMDEILKNLVIEGFPQAEFMFGQELYWIGLFGDPATDKTWGWQLDGHHLALNITIIDNEVSVRPMFMGSDPARVLEGMYAGFQPQGGEDEKGKLFFNSLDAKQRTTATINKVAPSDVITGPTRGDQLKTPTGLPVSDLNAEQMRFFLQLLAEYVHNFEYNIAEIQMQRILSPGLEKLHFAWAGTGNNEPYYYRIHGPTVLIEFNNNYPPGQKSGPINHIHTVFREPGNDYGEDLLKKHLLESPHHAN